MDREKVIKALEYCRDNELVNDCNKCDYGGKTGVFCIGMINDVLTLLKEQEAVEPSFKQDKDGIFVWCCGSCGAYMYHIYDGIDKAKEYAKFCRQCGKPVLWGGR